VRYDVVAGLDARPTPVCHQRRGEVASRAVARRHWKPVLLVAVCIALLVLGAIGRYRGPTPAPPAPAPPAPVLAAPAPPAAWLGLNYNSGANTGGLRDFAIRGVVYDREGSIEVGAGEAPENAPQFGGGLDRLYAARMVPDIEVDPAGGPLGCEANPNPRKLCLPTDQADIGSYVRGFIQTASSVLHSHPGKRVLFEPMNEPWDWASPPGTPSGKVAAAEYAAILVQLLPAARAAKVPSSDIYVPATGMLGDRTSWISDLYDAQPCLKPGANSCGPIAGWNLHPYGLPNSSTEGIASVPGVRAEMLSGQDNLIVSEIGFCATDVGAGRNCNKNQADIDGTSSQAAAWLAETLREAAPMHQAGWLKALLIWERAGGGWAMQNADGSLTAQGRALDLFADSPAGR
jgi:hypothetical protein